MGTEVTDVHGWLTVIRVYWSNRTYFKKHLLEVILFITDRLHYCDEHTRYHRD
ncbi:MAG: hypothetical protein KatS3mg056_2979 [Chloroflexus sp.]|nr:MAG: hypothetical protein KatS3mg056_2979 [Chloroflexus sp.]